MIRYKCLLVFVLCAASLVAFSQRSDSTRMIQHVSGSASITNNGISLIPSFSLGKPAVLLLMSLGGNKFSIDPDIRFGLNGKPWTFLFWARYKLFTKGPFRMHTGAHLGMNFRTTALHANGGSTENIVVRRYLAGELAPSYAVAKNVAVGAYYLYSRGIDAGTVKNTQFITLNGTFSKMPISRQWYLRATPQVFYLNQDGTTGYYFNAALTLARNHFPLSISSLFNKAIHADIPGKDFIWSLSLVYSFNKNYVPKMQAL